MKKICCTAEIAITVLWGFCLGIYLTITVQGKEEPQVIYDFVEITEEVPVYETPDYENRKDFTIPQGETVLVISETADGWYQILYHEEILYIDSKNESMEEAEISKEVIEEMEKDRENQKLAKKEIGNFIKSYDESQSDTMSVNFSKIILGIVALVVILSGIGYLYISKKEHIEQLKKEKQAEIEENDK